MLSKKCLSELPAAGRVLSGEVRGNAQSSVAVGLIARLRSNATLGWKARDQSETLVGQSIVTRDGYQLVMSTLLENFMNRNVLAVAVLLLVAGTGLCQQKTQQKNRQNKRDAVWNYPPQLPGSRTEVYKTVDDVELQAWVYEPDREQFKGKRPAIVFFFGGGWKAGTPGQFAKHCQYLASRGMVAITADYRVAGRHGIKANACVADCKSAVRWVRKNAGRLGVDPDRIAAGGGSAGGHTAACTAVIEGLDDSADDLSISSVPNALALFNPAVMLEKYNDDPRWDELAERRYKKEPLETRTGVPPRQISPVHHVRSGLPPTIILHGEADTTVPFWTVQSYSDAAQKAGNRCELKGYPAAGHGFFNVGRGGSAERQDGERRMFAKTIVDLDMFLASLGYVSGPPAVVAPSGSNVHLRGSLLNSFVKFQNSPTAHVAFLGGSITEAAGYRVMVGKWLQEKFPGCKFTFTSAGIGSTCSTTGAFRLSDDVLQHGPVDLFFVEYAVNDDQDAGHAAQECVRGMEGVVRHVRESNSKTDIVMTHFINLSILKLLQQGKTSVSIANHEAVAIHYGVSSVHLAKEVADRITSNDITWKMYGGTHPKPFGYQICADMMIDLLSSAWKQSNPRTTGHAIPDSLLDKHSYVGGRFLDSEKIKLVDGWKYSIPDWKSLPGGKRARFTNLKMVSCTTADKELTIAFSGTAIGAYVVAGPDAGIVAASVDGGEFKSVDLFHRFSKGLHYPRTVMFASELADGAHTLKLRMSHEHHKSSLGTAVRVVHFVVND